MKVLEKVLASGSLAEYVDEAVQNPIIITVDGKPVAALTSLEGADWETISLSTNPQFLSIIERSRSRYRQEGGVPGKKVREMFQDGG